MYITKRFALSLILLCLIAVVSGQEYDGQSMFGKIKSSFAYAGKMLGLDRAAEVAQLVSNAFSRNSRKGDTDGPDPSNTMFSGFLRLLGFDTKRIGAIAVNAIIFIAQIISTSLAKPPPAYVTEGRKLDGTPLEWMMQNTQVQSYLKHAKDRNLPNHLIDYLKETNGSGPNTADSTGCLQLLICKTKPLIWGMQRAINAKGAKIVTGMRVLSEYLPTLDEMADNGDDCELKFPHCKLHLT